LLECDQHFRPGVPFFYVSDGLGGLRQRVASVDHRGYFSGLDQSAEGRQVVSIDIRNEEFELLSQERRPRECFEQSGEHSPEFLWSSGHDTLAIRTQNALHRRQRAVSHVIEKQVVTFAVLSEVLAGIVDDPVSAEGAHQFNILRAANADYISPN